MTDYASFEIDRQLTSQVKSWMDIWRVGETYIDNYIADQIFWYHDVNKMFDKLKRYCLIIKL